MTMPGECSSGLSPRPSGGGMSRRANGFSSSAVIARKKTCAPASTGIAHGTKGSSSGRFRVAKTPVYTDRIRHHSRSDPAMPAHSAENVYQGAAERDVLSATYRREKSRVKNAYHSRSAAPATQTSTAID